MFSEQQCLQMAMQCLLAGDYRGRDRWMDLAETARYKARTDAVADHVERPPIDGGRLVDRGDGTYVPERTLRR